MCVAWQEYQTMERRKVYGRLVELKDPITFINTPKDENYSKHLMTARDWKTLKDPPSVTHPCVRSITSFIFSIFCCYSDYNSLNKEELDREWNKRKERLSLIAEEGEGEREGDGRGEREGGDEEGPVELEIDNGKEPPDELSEAEKARLEKERKLREELELLKAIDASNKVMRVKELSEEGRIEGNG